MQEDAGVRLKCLGGRLAWGRWPISLVYRATEWSCYGASCATSSCLPPRQPGTPPRHGHHPRRARPHTINPPPRGEPATLAGGSRIIFHPVVPKNNLSRAGNRIARHRQYIPIPLYSITTQVRATQWISLDNLLTP